MLCFVYLFINLVIYNILILHTCLTGYVFITEERFYIYMTTAYRTYIVLMLIYGSS